MHLKVIVVSPKYQMNVGYIARTARNFGINELSFVKPRANINGKKAVMFSKHAADLLRNAKVYKTFDSSISDCDAVMGTTGIWRNGEKINEHEYTLKEALGILSKRYSENAVMGLVVGRDDTGLNREEVETQECRCFLWTERRATA